LFWEKTFSASSSPTTPPGLAPWPLLWILVPSTDPVAAFVPENPNDSIAIQLCAVRR
jgi:hypothetical protein